MSGGCCGKPKQPELPFSVPAPEEPKDATVFASAATASAVVPLDGDAE